jgi:8-oxo-dGTP pyrophosphatase MutT (NUDIX family)
LAPHTVVRPTGVIRAGRTVAGMVHVAPEVWYRQLATCYTAAGGLLRDDRGRILLVKPNYRDGWSLPGGVVEADEPPHVACAREVLEEVGLRVPVGRLLVVDWAPAEGDRPRPFMHFLFDCGTVAEQPIVLQDSELDEHGFFPPDDAARLVAPHIARRVPAAIRAAAAGTTVYLPADGLDDS